MQHVQEENCKISTDGLKVDFTGKGIVLTKEGFKKGVHQWEVVVHFIEIWSHLGNFIETSSKILMNGLMDKQQGFCVIGKSIWWCWKKSFFFSCKSTIFESTQRFKPGDHVSFTLDCEQQCS